MVPVRTFAAVLKPLSDIDTLPALTWAEEEMYKQDEPRIWWASVRALSCLFSLSFNSLSARASSTSTVRACWRRCALTEFEASFLNRSSLERGKRGESGENNSLAPSEACAFAPEYL